MPPIQMQFSQKPNTFSEFFCDFKIYIKFWKFPKKDDARNWFIAEITDFENRGYIIV